MIRASHADARPNFYPRPPGGGRQPDEPPRTERVDISIHALRVEGDTSWAATHH